MSTIVTTVKERLRSRSRHRYSTRGRSIDDTRPPLPSVAIDGWQHGNGYDLPKSLRQTALAEPRPEDNINTSPTEDKALPQIPPERGLGLDPGMLAQSLSNTLTSSTFPQSHVPPSPRQPVPDRYSSLLRKDRLYTADGASHGHRRAISQPIPQRSSARDAVPEYPLATRKAEADRTPSSRPKSRHIPIASTSSQLGQYEAQVAAKEESSRKSNESNSSSINPASVTQVSSSNRSFPPRKDSLEYAEQPRGRVPGHRTGRSRDLAPSDPSPYLPRFQDREHEMLATAGTRQAMKVPDDVQIPELPATARATGSYTKQPPPVKVPSDVRLPENFKLESYLRTNVSTEWLPAVTQEVVHHQKTEIVQKEITRDVHIHHFYEYFQPIKVVEILPARHWFLDPRTGKKIEVPEPNGWKMPENMRPANPDTSSVAKKTRHYLVDEEFPEGLEEEAPTEGVFDEASGGGIKRSASVNSSAAAAATAA